MKNLIKNTILTVALAIGLIGCVDSVPTPDNSGRGERDPSKIEVKWETSIEIITFGSNLPADVTYSLTVYERYGGVKELINIPLENNSTYTFSSVDSIKYDFSGCIGRVAVFKYEKLGDKDRGKNELNFIGKENPKSYVGILR